MINKYLTAGSVFTFFVLLLPIFSYGQIQKETTLTINSNKIPIICKGDTIQLSTPKISAKAQYYWMRNNQLIEAISDNILSVTEPGTYQVYFEMDSITYFSNPVELQHCNKDPKDEIVNPNTLLNTPIITSNDNVICGSYTEAHLTCSLQDPSYTYRWYYSTSYSGTYNLISGATTYTYTATQVGYYKVFVDDVATVPGVSNPFQVYSAPIISLTDANDYRYPTISSTPGASVTLKASFTGATLPVKFTIQNGIYTQTITATTNPYSFTVQPNVNTKVSIVSLESSCGGNYTTNGNSAYIIVDNSTDFTLNPTTTNVCLGKTYEIPYTTTGTWGTARNFYAYLVNESTGSTYASWSGETTSPLKFNIPTNLTLNTTYKLYVSSTIPYVQSQKSISIIPTSSNCTTTPFILMSPSNEGCSSVVLSAQPTNGNYTYSWYKDNVLITAGASNTYSATSSGNYKVVVTDATTNTSASSSQYPVTVQFAHPKITANNLSICNSSLGITLSSSVNNSTYSYQWYYRSSYNSSSTAITGATGSTYNTTLPGFYQLTVWNGTCLTTSDEFTVVEGSYIKATNVNDENTETTINSGSSTTIKLTLAGVAPYTITYNDGKDSKVIVTNNATYNLVVSPTTNTRYSFSVSSNCGSTSSAYFTVTVNPSASFALTTPTNTTVCQLDFIDLPFTTSGTWPTEKRFYVSVYDANTNYYYYGDDIVTSSNSIPFYIGSNIAPGTYKLSISATVPYISNSQSSTYTITVKNSGCTTPNARIIKENISNCTKAYLTAYPKSTSTTSYTYSWYRNGTLFSSGGSSYLFTSNDGNYYVVVTDGNGFTSTSNTIAVSATNFINNLNTISNDGLCNSGVTLNPQNAQTGNTYEWYYSTGGLSYTNLGLTTPTITTTASGKYMVITKNGACENVNFFACSLLLTLTNQSVCLGSTIKISYNNIWGLSEAFKFQLLDATTNAVVVENLVTTTLIQDSNGYLNVTLPTSVTAGTYKVRAFSTVDNTIANTSDAIITVKNGTFPAPLTLLASPTSIASSQSVLVTASSCNGSYLWNTGQSDQSISKYLYNGYEFQVSCRDVNGCVSPVSSLIVPYQCTDAYEPNDNGATAAPVIGETFTSTPICFGYNTDQDWFSFVINGRKYYAMARHYSSSTNTPKQFYFKKDVAGNVLTLQTYAAVSGEYYDTIIYLFDANLQQIGKNDDSNGDGFSIITYNLTNNCQSNVELLTTEYDIHSSETSTVKSTNYIKSSVKIMDAATAAFEAQNYILLLPGFETKISTQGVFRAEIKPCN